MAKNIIRTRKPVAKTASYLLSNSNNRKVKSVAGGALGNRRRYS